MPYLCSSKTSKEMKRILTIICAIAFSGVALSAQNNADNIYEKSQKPAYMVNVGYNRGYRADIELSWENKSLWGISSSHGFSFGNGLYVGGGAGFWADMTKNADATGHHSYLTPVFADIKYSFTKTLVSPFVSMKGGAIADITNNGIRLFANPAVGLDIARFSLKVGYEYQLGVWGYFDGNHMHNVKLGVAYTF